MLFACYPAKDIDVGVLVACAVKEVISEQPSVLRLLLSVRHIRRTCKFRPTIAEIIETLEDVVRQSPRRGRSSSFPSVWSRPRRACRSCQVRTAPRDRTFV